MEKLKIVLIESPQPLDQILDVIIMFKSELMRAADQLGGWSRVQLQQIL